MIRREVVGTKNDGHGVVSGSSSSSTMTGEESDTWGRRPYVRAVSFSFWCFAANVNRWIWTIGSVVDDDSFTNCGRELTPVFHVDIFVGVYIIAAFSFRSVSESHYSPDKRSVSFSARSNTFAVYFRKIRERNFFSRYEGDISFTRFRKTRTINGKKERKR